MIISALKALYDRSRKNDNIDVVLLGIAKKKIRPETIIQRHLEEEIRCTIIVRMKGRNYESNI